MPSRPPAIASPTEMSYQLHRIVMLLAGLALLAAGCKSSAAPPPGSQPEDTSQQAVRATLEPGDVRFLLARRNQIDEITLSGQQSNVVTLDTLDGRVNVLNMALTSDGSQIAFVVELPAYTNEKGEIDFGADLYVSDRDGSNVRRVLAHENVGDYFEVPNWLDETTLIVGWRGLDESGAFSRIETVNVDTGEHKVGLENAAMGALSPDGMQIVYTQIDPETRVQHLVIESLAANDEPRLLVGETSGLALFSGVKFSPDGSRIAFAAVDLTTSVPPPAPPTITGPGGAYDNPSTVHPFAEDIWLVNTDATGLHRVAEVAENMPSVSWAGDGIQIYVLGPGFLWRLNADTGDAEQLRQSEEPGAIVWLEGG